MKGFLGPHFKNFQTVADGQRKVSEDPGATSGTATSAAQSTAGDEAFRKSAKISDEDQPSISEDVQRGLKGTSYRTEGAVLVAGGMGSSPDVAVDPSLDKAYVVTEGGKLYAVDLATHTKRQVMTFGDPDGSLGAPGGVALDGNGNAYVTDRSGGRVLRVRLSTGHTEKVATVTQACGIGLDETGTKAYVTAWDGKLFEVDLQSTEAAPRQLVELGTSTSAVALDGRARRTPATLTRRGACGKSTSRPLHPASRVGWPGLPCGGAVASRWTARAAYVADHWVDMLYRVDLASGKERDAVKARSGSFSPLGVTLDSAHGMVYVSTWEGQLWRFSLRVLQSPELIEITTGV